MKSARAYIIWIVLLLSLGAHPLKAQPLSTNIKIQAMEMARAVLAKDIDKLALYIPPGLVAAAGGKERMLIARDTLNKYMQQFGADIKKVTIGEPAKVVSFKGQLQSFLPQTTELSFMASRIILETTLLAYSTDEGKHWYFIDTGIYRGEKFKAYIPEISPELIIPPLKPPKIITDQP